MHAALRISDIVQEVFLHIHEDASSDNLKTAYRAALVCKQFLPHALDVLWFSMNTLGPLIALIPNSTTADTESLRFSTPLSDEDLAVFDLHARRVKRLVLPIKHGIGVPVMMKLLDCLGRFSLLPNLRMLSLNARGAALNESDCFFLCPSLKYLSIRGLTDKDLNLFLHRVVEAAPSLQHLDLFDGPTPFHLLPFLKLPLLESLNTESDIILSPDTFPSSFPFAGHLTTWRAASIDLCHGDSILAHSIEFPSLTTLELIDAIPSDDLATLFSQSVFPQLRDLIFRVPPYDGRRGNAEDATAYKTSWLNLFPLLFKKRRCLQLVHLTGDNYYGRREETEMDLGDFFADMESQTLKTFWLDDPKLIKPLTLASINRLCTVFPFLNNLSLYLPELAYISFDDLAVLVERLPLLYYLNIDINGVDLADPPSVPILSHHLKTLCIGDSQMRDPLMFVRYIDRLFPFADIQSAWRPEAKLLMSAHKLVRGCRKDQEERSIP